MLRPKMVPPPSWGLVKPDVGFISRPAESDQFTPEEAGDFTITDELPEEEAPESKAAAERRWKAEGIYDEATRYRTERRIEYHNSGLTKIESREKSWRETMLKYPKPGVESVEPPGVEIPDPVLLSPTESPEQEEDPIHIPATDMDVAGDIAWTYGHIGDEKVRADQAPSAGAWSMLQFGREARHKFLELVTKYDQSAKGDDVEAKEFQADADAHINAIQKLLSTTEAVHYDAVLDAIRQAPGEVERALQKAGWGVARPADEPLEPAGIGTGASSTECVSNSELTASSVEHPDAGEVLANRAAHLGCMEMKR